jgi:putative FmdB family regulatory protein
MPTYLYHCDACNSEFEKEQRIVEPPLKKCANCGKSKARRLITGGNFILKGGGWYSDGYGSSKPSSPAASEGSSKGSSSKTETKADAKSDAKTETKSEAKSEKKSEGGGASKPAQSSSSD